MREQAPAKRRRRLPTPPEMAKYAALLTRGLPRCAGPPALGPRAAAAASGAADAPGAGAGTDAPGYAQAHAAAVRGNWQVGGLFDKKGRV